MKLRQVIPTFFYPLACPSLEPAKQFKRKRLNGFHVIPIRRNLEANEGIQACASRFEDLLFVNKVTRINHKPLHAPNITSNLFQTADCDRAKQFEI